MTKMRELALQEGRAQYLTSLNTQICKPDDDDVATNTQFYPSREDIANATTIGFYGPIGTTRWAIPGWMQERQER